MGREDAALESALALHGEAFMSMFDDDDDDVSERRGAATGRAQRDSKGAHPIDDDDDTIADVAAEEEENGDVDDIFKGIRNDGKVLKRTTEKRKKKRKSLHTSVPSHSTMDGDEDLEDELARRRIEKKRFMSSKADVILGSDVSGRHTASTAKKRRKKKEPSNRGKDLLMEDKEEFKKLSREIQHFGASGLDKKSRAKFEEHALIQLGAKKKKGARIPASIGIGMAKKAAQREKRALEQAIAAGMVSRKAASKKSEQGKNGIDRGLNEDMGAFKGGVLRINRGTKRK